MEDEEDAAAKREAKEGEKLPRRRLKKEAACGEAEQAAILEKRKAEGGRYQGGRGRVRQEEG